MCDHSNREGTAFLVGAAIGALAGAAAGLLLAPESGEETRRRLKAQGTRAWNEAKRDFELVEERVGPAVTELERRIKPIVERLESAGEPVKDAFVEKIEELASEVGAKIEEESRDVKRKFFSNVK